jgi:hypothetical protein
MAAHSLLVGTLKSRLYKDHGSDNYREPKENTEHPTDTAVVTRYIVHDIALFRD